MSITNSLNSALSGLAANARRADVASSNIANALTDGYGRRVLDVSSRTAGYHGSGVRIDGVRRLSDPVILADRRNADGAAAAADRRSDALATVEAAIGGPGAPDGIAARLAAVESALIAATGDPASDTRLKQTYRAMTDLTGSLDRASTVVQAERVRADADIAVSIETLNRSFGQVRDLNSDVQRALATGRDPSALIDQRQVVIDRISQIVPVREIPQADGRIALWSTGGMQLVDGRAVHLGFQPRATITPDMTRSSGALSGLSVDGAPLTNGGVGRLTGGSLEALFDLRDDALVQRQQDLDEIAQDLMIRFSDPAVDPTLAPGSGGLFIDTNPIPPASDPTGLSQRLTVDPRLDPQGAAETWRLRTGMDAAGPGEAGDPSQLLRFSDAFMAPLAISASGPMLTTFDRVAKASESASLDRLAAEESAVFSAARRDSLRSAELANGVDTDAELQTLLLVEQAYAANARVVETIDQMIRRLMEI